MLQSLLFCIILLSPSIVLSLDVLNDDVLGLIVFKAGVHDPKAKLVSWNDSDDNPCYWIGVKCDPMSNRVIELVLDGFSLSGQVSRGLLRLQFLQNLSLSNNNFSGSINPDFAHLWSLQSIDLSGNSLSGSIPNELFQQCGALKFVSFANNGHLTGEIPDSLCSCMTLETVNFSSNKLSGRLPAKIWSLSGLKYFDLSNNLLQGEIPGGIGSMYSLRVISLRRNSFTGLLPEDIGDCLQLQSIDFSENSFSGILPDSMQKLNMSTSLSLRGNLLSGEIPYWIGQMQSLKSLDLSLNQLFGRIPTSIGTLQSLTELNLSSNGFTGGLPESIVNCVNLLSMDFSQNDLRGNMPSWLFKLGLHRFSLSGNQFTGTIKFPSFSLTGFSYQTLQFMDLSSNGLSGIIPSEIGDFSGLQYLNMSSNSLIGAIPASIGKLNAVRVIDLSYNRLNGSIPMEIVEAVSMRELRLEKNFLTGKIPSQIKSCTSLTVLILSENSLMGPIPASLANLTDLQIVDLSRNNLSGSLPKELPNLSHLLSFNISDNQLEGELPVGGFFNSIPLSSVSGNPSLCGSIFNRTCPAVHPKPIVLNPNSSNSIGSSLSPNLRHKKLVLSVSSLIAVSAAAFIFIGVVAVTILNFHVRHSASRSAAPLAFSGKDDLSQSPISDSDYGKLVMFSGDTEFRPGAHALLNKDCELGRGGFGAVYRTNLPSGRSVAIKKLTISSLIKSQEDFEREVKKLGKIRHPNLVSLEGYYWTPSLQLLITEYVSGGNLYDLLHKDSTGCCRLSWHQRFDIIVGMAKGLAHLHRMSVIHYNLKSTNVLLDSFGEPKVGDFGLVRLLPMLDRYLLSSKIQSALGYVAPEFACRTVKITEKSDVYGFGILVLEIVTGRKPVEYMEDDVVVLCDMVRGALGEGKVEDCIDRRLQGNFPAEEAVPVVKLGLICSSQVPSNRPDMVEVINILELIKCPSEGKDEQE
ncbi:hypothetical protein Nepgr_028228 [Nepenthes gracilis]|uniref:Protein kinase domain-containing protein n=1 Tax=Nepenthes gracilis TaxID=150966 RepID=A0AAD3Y3R2_NEPGR|nr:hypothetical protein Nepgr_028228 [Nepenthes gracilis]